MKTNKSEVLLAFDKSSVRRTDTDGRLFLETSRISKAGVNPYWGREIPKYDELGLDPDKVYQVSHLSSHAWAAGLRSNVFASPCTTRPSCFRRICAV
ncbi:DUF2213 domain-containing protein [Paraburkholderia sediminicola]|uniref:DUF2213 domain-containing protein n=1 Tax=Paraburkholderia sediminicola TaxID=458836 RepID=UPI0038B90962